MLISGKGKCFPLFGCFGNRFPENHFRCLVGPNILRKSFYGKSCSWIGVDRSSGFWVGVDRSSGFWVGFVLSGSWIEAHRDRIGLGRSTGSLDRSLLSTSMCCCAWIDPVLLCVRWFSVSLLSSLCVAVRGDVIRKWIEGKMKT